MKYLIVTILKSTGRSLPLPGAWIEIKWWIDKDIMPESLPLPGAWIEINMPDTVNTTVSSLPLPGAWIEIDKHMHHHNRHGSLPLPGAWIEIVIVSGEPSATASRSLYRERGLKFNINNRITRNISRSLYRERGLKFTSSFLHCLRRKGRSLYRERGLKFLRIGRIFVLTLVAPFTGSVD